jgi:hypothetical protein
MVTKCRRCLSPKFTMLLERAMLNCEEIIKGNARKLLALRILVDGDVNARIKKKDKDGAGGSALYWAVELHGEDHPVTRFLKSPKFVPGQGNDEL